MALPTSAFARRRSAARAVSCLLCAAMLLASASACSSSSSSDTAQDTASQTTAAEPSGDSAKGYESILDNNVGDVVKFGEYDWFIIDKSANGCTLLSKDTLGELKYNNSDSTDVTPWKDSALRAWINNENNIHF